MLKTEISNLFPSDVDAGITLLRKIAWLKANKWLRETGRVTRYKSKRTDYTSAKYTKYCKKIIAEELAKELAAINDDDLSRQISFDVFHHFGGNQSVLIRFEDYPYLEKVNNSYRTASSNSEKTSIRETCRRNLEENLRELELFSYTTISSPASWGYYHTFLVPLYSVSKKVCLDLFCKPNNFEKVYSMQDLVLYVREILTTIKKVYKDEED